MQPDVLAVAGALRRHPVFRRVSLRQLADLVRLAWPDVTRVALNTTERVTGVFLLVLEGQTIVANRRMRPGDLLYTGEEALTDPAMLQDIARDPQPSRAFADVLHDREVAVTARSPDGALVLPLKFRIVEAALRASASFCTSVALDPLASGRLAELLATMNPAWELIWVCSDPTLGAPMEALTRLLAAAVATQLRQRVAVVVGDKKGLRYAIWHHDEFTGTQTLNPDLHSVFGKLQYRIFVVCPDSPDVPPPALCAHDDRPFDRIVYVTEAVPKKVPPEFGRHLHPDALDPIDHGEPYFSSFIPSVVLNGPPLPSPRPGFPPLRALARAIVSDALAFAPEPIPTFLGLKAAQGFATEVLDERTFDPATGAISPPRSALGRDSCRLRFDLGKLGDMWRTAVIDDTAHAYHRAVFTRYPAYARTAARWARAVTNKRIGFAVSGDGATSYRLVALLRLLEQAGVPIDVFGGVSGGANLGAYYCRDGADGLEQYVGQTGKVRSIATALLASLTSQPIESGIDWAFSGTTLDDLEVRFLAVTTALPECGPPESHVVVRGTLGAAVRASGSLPLFFARTIKGGILYSDGALANPMPVRALPNYGADYVIACNSVPGPDNRNPLRQWPGLDALYRWSCLGPLIDVWVANAYSHQRRAEEAAASADVAIAMTPNTLSLFEVLLWMIPEFLLDEAGRDPRILAGVEAVKQFWSRRKGT